MVSIEVTVVSTLRSYQCRTTISTHTNQTVDSLIKDCCLMNEWTRRSDFALCNRQQEIFYRGDKLHVYDVQNGDELYLIIHESERWACGCSQWWLLTLICLLISVCGLTAVIIMEIRSRNVSLNYRYAVGFDAGSSHTQLFIYRWMGNKYKGTGIVSQVYTCPSKNETAIPGINSFIKNPSAAGKSLSQCLHNSVLYLNSTSEAVNFAKTPILLGATAGMRLLEMQNKTIADEIMKSVRDEIKSYPFNTSELGRQTRIIDGAEEGAFAWITTNFLNGTFGFTVLSKIDDPTSLLNSADDLKDASMNGSQTIGALDLGGASTQISFEPFRGNASTADYETLDLYGSRYTIYTHSYLCYGLNEAMRRYWARLVEDQGNNETIVDPCAPDGNATSRKHAEIFQYPCTSNLSDTASTDEDKFYTFLGASNSTECRRLTMTLFDFNATCLHPPCSFNGTHQPPVHGPILAFSGFYYTMRFLNLTDDKESKRLKDFMNAKESYCRKTWEQVEHVPLRRGEDAMVLVTSCFRANYIQALLVDGYHFNATSWEDITFKSKVNGADLGWIVGMMVNATNLIPAVAPSPESMSVVMFALLLACFIFFFVLSVLFACYARNVARREKHGYKKLQVQIDDPSPVSTASTTTSTDGAIEDREPLPV